LIIDGPFGPEFVLTTRPYRTLPVIASLTTYSTARDMISDCTMDYPWL